jgi:phosphoenolpyruvate-protein kinase (PTS system EI component)
MTETITIQGYEFPVQPRYKAGHTLTDLEAEALNQAYWDNLRNNFTNKVKAAKSQSGGLSEATHQDLVRQFEGYAQDYQFGQRRAAADPIYAQIEAQAVSLARTAIRDAMRQQGQKDAYSAEEIEAAAHDLVGTDPSFREKAQKAVEERRANAEAALRALLRPAGQNGTEADNSGQSGQSA